MKPGVRLIYPDWKNDSKLGFKNHKHNPATLQTLCFNSMIQGMYLIRFETWSMIYLFRNHISDLLK